VFNRILLSACTAGIVAAIVLATAQALWVTPLIMQAEELEDAAQDSRAQQHAPQSEAAEHHHEQAWQPENGWQRTLATAASNSVMGIGYALMLCGIYAQRKPANIIQGLGWGLAGYFVFFAAPAAGLPPELPGTASAELAARQYWWLCTAAATAAGLGLVFFQSRNALRAVGAMLVIAPHLIGAPHPAAPASLAPEELQAQFRVVTIFVNALFWLLLGLISVAAFRYFSRPQNKPQ
jgi:cobalt transporter subunit CbtA